MRTTRTLQATMVRSFFDLSHGPEARVTVELPIVCNFLKAIDMPIDRNAVQRIFRVIAYLWASPNTLLGLVFAIGSEVRLVRGVVEIHGPLTRFFLDRCGPIRGASAMTLGHVVIAQNQACLDSSRRHERIHVRQYETYGPFFIPLYFWASLHAWRTGQDFYYDNFFEVEAYRLDGGD